MILINSLFYCLHLTKYKELSKDSCFIVYTLIFAQGECLDLCHCVLYALQIVN